MYTCIGDTQDCTAATVYDILSCHSKESLDPGLTGGGGVVIIHLNRSRVSLQ